MDEQQASAIADGLLDAARAQRAKRSARASRFTGAALRFQTGVATLIGAAVGYGLAHSGGFDTTWCVVAAAIVGLITAITWPPLRRHA